MYTTTYIDGHQITPRILLKVIQQLFLPDDSDSRWEVVIEELASLISRLDTSE